MHDRLTKAARVVDMAPISFLPDDDAGQLDRIVAGVRKWHASLPVRKEGEPKQGVPVVFIDYFQLLKILGSFNREDLKYAHGAHVLTQLAKSLGILIVVCAQLLKAVAGRDQARPRLGDIKEASALEDTASHVISIYRPALATAKVGELTATVKRIRWQEANLKRRGHSLPAAEQEELDAAEEALAEAYIDILKARNGELGSHPAHFEGRFTRVSTTPAED
jgi:replicative DNA helicase